MQTQTIIYIILAVLTALLLALFQYIYKSKKSSSLNVGLSLLRFLSIFGILVLLINPKFSATSYYEEKPTLVIAVDNSESVSYLKQDAKVKELVNTINFSSDLKNRFNLEFYKFGSEFKLLDSLSFEERQSNMANVFKSIEDIYNNETKAIVFISDGNQTYGQDYQYINTNSKTPINTVILGDTTTYLDVNIKQVNVNRYAYLKNKFPVEIITNYSGLDPVSTKVEIISGNSTVFSKVINFNSDKTSEIISTNLIANRVGVQSYRVLISRIESERNVINNSKNFAVEVIDQKTNIALVSERLHPDLGAIKKSIESNEQRSVTLLKPSDYQLFILYQPNGSFNKVLKAIFEEKRNTFIISGATTDWILLNSVQPFYVQEITNQTEEYQPELNINFTPFIIEDSSFENFPPLESEFGDLKFNLPTEILLYKSFNGINTNQPLLSSFEADNQKHAVLSGEGFWKWRAQSFLQNGDFYKFDNIIGKLVQYLSSSKKRSRLSLDYKSFYNGGETIIISAQYFNKSYEFDSSANLQIRLRNKETDALLEVPLLLKNNDYAVDLSSIEPGEYSFVVENTVDPISASGEFTVLEYNVEQQFLNADVSKMKTIANNSDGKSYFIDNTSYLITDLMDDSRFAIIQKQKTDVVPLIDWKYLLGFILLTLSLEWFIRKYNGLI